MKTRKIISLLLVLIILTSSMSFYSFAEEECIHKDGFGTEKRVEPTCSDKGNITYKYCKHHCGYYTDTKGNPITYEDTIIPATGIHTYGEDGRCTVCGYKNEHTHSGGVATCITKAVCDGCGEEYGEYDKQNHNSDDFYIVDSLEATCEAEGYSGDKYYTCCNTLMEKGETIPKKSHIESTRVENEIAPTCGENGSYDKITFCTKCNAVIKSEHITVPATGEHNYFIEVKGSKVEATCSAKGSVKYKCLCSAETTVEIDINPYAHSYGEWITTENATCTSNGLMKRVCKHNSAHVETKTIYTDGHDLKLVEAKDSTCTSEGNIAYYKCTECDKCYSDAECMNELNDVTIGKKEHSFTRYVSNNDASCKADGTLTAVCDYCKNETDIKTDEGSKNFAPHTPSADGTVCTLCGKALAVTHIWSDTEAEIKAPTCTEDGAKAIVCTECGEIKEGTKEVIPATGHNYTEEWKVILDADCQQKGVKIIICRNCLDVISEIIPKTEHTDENSDGICEICGYNSNPAVEPVNPVVPSPGTGPDLPTPDEPVPDEPIPDEPAPEVPDEPTPDEPTTEEPDEIVESDPSENCSCGCHKSGIAGFFFDILNFFYKLFGINRICSCGALH